MVFLEAAGDECAGVIDARADGINTASVTSGRAERADAQVVVGATRPISMPASSHIEDLAVKLGWSQL